MTDIFTFHPWSDGGSVEVAGVTVRVRAVDHPCEAYAVRVEHGGRSLAYSGDTGAVRRARRGRPRRRRAAVRGHLAARHGAVGRAADRHPPVRTAGR